ncbi:restriction endonuclease subunit S [Micromonospora sp. NPDC048898]|uniref:restriction endonuclease subunit S n=1 Tax=Micromonospora sp. NPDC048898 TaxID=3364260 RepID=UPI00371E62F2
MSEFNRLLAEHCSDGVEVMMLGEIGTFVRGRRFTKADMVEEGIPCIHYGEIYTEYGVSTRATVSYVREDLRNQLRYAQPGDVIVASVGETVEDVGKAVAWLGEGEVAIHDDSFLFRSELNPTYVSYYFQTSAFRAEKEQHVARAKVKRLSSSGLSRVTIPVPPPEVQSEIVRILDKMIDLQAELQAELQARARQYEHYRDQLLTFTERDKVRWATLGELATVRTGQPPGDVFASVTKGGAIPFVNAGTTASGWVLEANTQGDAVTIPSRGQGGVGVVGYQAYDFWCGPLCYRVRSVDVNIVTTKYLYYFLKSIQPSIRRLQQAGGTPALNRKELITVEVALPSRGEQERIVAILDRFDALTSDMKMGLPAEIEARRKQYEYYRDRLLKFKEKVA